MGAGVGRSVSEIDRSGQWPDPEPTVLLSVGGEVRRRSHEKIIDMA